MTVLLAVSVPRSLLPPQLLYAGKTEKCHLSSKFPNFTRKLQPLDLTIKGEFERMMKNYFSDWYTKEIIKRLVANRNFDNPHDNERRTLRPCQNEPTNIIAQTSSCPNGSLQNIKIKNLISSELDFSTQNLMLVFNTNIILYNSKILLIIAAYI